MSEPSPAQEAIARELRRAIRRSDKLDIEIENHRTMILSAQQDKEQVQALIKSYRQSLDGQLYDRNGKLRAKS